jgi:hypothetical protein
MNTNEQSTKENNGNTSALGFAQDLNKLLISLSSGVIAISAAFAERLSTGVGLAILFLILSWLSLTISIFFGINSLSKVLHSKKTNVENWHDLIYPPLRKSNWFFFIGVALLIVYASLVATQQAFRKCSTKEENEKKVECIYQHQKDFKCLQCPDSSCRCSRFLYREYNYCRDKHHDSIPYKHK